MKIPYKIKFFLTLAVLILIFTQVGTGQSNNERQIPQVGKQIPYFELKNIQYFPKKSISSDNLSKNGIILDFFSMGCSSCFASFAKTNKLYQQFKDQVDIILVGREHKKIRETYEKFRKKKNLDLPVTYESNLFNQWGIKGVPHLIWVDNTGMVKAITGSRELNLENIQLFLKGESFYFIDAGVKTKESKDENYHPIKSLILDTPFGNDLLFLSSISNWNPRTTPQRVMRAVDVHNDNEDLKGSFEATGLTLEMLYQYAYYGERKSFSNYIYEGYKFYPKIQIELEDQSLFKFDFQKGKNLFNYSLIVPKEKAKREYMMKTIQKDLKNHFGYNVSFEKRVLPYWSLTTNEETKNRIKSKEEGESKANGTHAGFNLKNFTMTRLLSLLQGYHQGELPIIDETGIDFNIDLKIDALMTDFEDLKNVLAKQGLLLVKKKKQFLTMVISEEGDKYEKKK